MIFRSRRSRDRADETPDATSDDSLVAEVELGSEADEQGGDTDSEVEASTPEVDPAQLAELDELEWRDQGPWDISEVDLTEDSAGPRIDLGSLVLTGHDGMELRLQVDEETQQIVSAMMMIDDSALEVSVFAAPRSGGLWPELREDVIESAADVGGSATMAVGPFGVELRRLVPVRTPDGDEGYQPSRMWVVEGPRWMLRGVVFGPASLEEGVEGPVADLLAAFRAVVVRRGEETMAPGDLLALTIPTGLTPAEPSLQD